VAGTLALVLAPVDASPLLLVPQILATLSLGISRTVLWYATRAMVAVIRFHLPAARTGRMIALVPPAS
jgi:hypothetical protein